MMDHPPATNGRPPDGSWNPVILSVVVYPGVGQWMQRRYPAAMVFGITFTIMVVIFTFIFISYVRSIIPLFQQAFEGSVEGPLEIPPLITLIKPFGILMFIYIANVVDIFRGRLHVRRVLVQK